MAPQSQAVLRASPPETPAFQLILGQREPVSLRAEAALERLKRLDEHHRDCGLRLCWRCRQYSEVIEALGV